MTVFTHTVIEMPRPTVRKWCEHGYNAAFEKTKRDVSNYFRSESNKRSKAEQDTRSEQKQQEETVSSVSVSSVPEPPSSETTLLVTIPITLDDKVRIQTMILWSTPFYNVFKTLFYRQDTLYWKLWTHLNSSSIHDLYLFPLHSIMHFNPILSTTTRCSIWKLRRDRLQKRLWLSSVRSTYQRICLGVSDSCCRTFSTV